MNLQKQDFAGLILMIFLCFASNHSHAQAFNSLVGVRAGYKTVEFSAKIAMDKKNSLEGTVGVVTPQPDYTVGAGAAYHRHVYLNESGSFQPQGVSKMESGCGAMEIAI